jgi:hypothetical protein
VLQLLSNLFEFFLAPRNKTKIDEKELEKLTVLGATSGDTYWKVCKIGYLFHHIIPSI